MSKADLIHSVSAAFEMRFETAPQLIAFAPGRVNLIGEHTDYNGGFVLPAAIGYGTAVAARRRPDSTVRVVAMDLAQQVDQFDAAADIQFNKGMMWANYIRGVFQALKRSGYETGGFDLVVSGNVPQGAGLSSSASLEIALLEVVRVLSNLQIDLKKMALVGQAAENDFVGCQCGVMDQMVSAAGRKNHALLIDCRSLELQQIPVPSELRILIVNSNRQRGLVESAYNERRLQCEEAAAQLGVEYLRDVSLEQFESAQHQLSPLVLKRARHVISENERTLQAAEAFRHGDLSRLGDLMAASHASMRDDFEITVPEIDYLVSLLQGVIGSSGGVRMTGGGFGGCVVSILPQALIQDAVEVVASSYESETGLKPEIFQCVPEAGVSQRMADHSTD